MGQGIADQVRRALIAAAKVAPVAVAIDVAGWGCSDDCASYEPPCLPTKPGLTVVSLASLPSEHSTRGLSPCISDPGEGKRTGDNWIDATQTLGCVCRGEEEFPYVTCIGYPMCIRGRLADGTADIAHYVACMYSECPPPGGTGVGASAGYSTSTGGSPSTGGAHSSGGAGGVGGTMGTSGRGGRDAGRDASDASKDAAVADGAPDATDANKDAAVDGADAADASKDGG